MHAPQMKGTLALCTIPQGLLLSSPVVLSGVPRYKRRLEEKAKGLLLKISLEWQGSESDSEILPSNPHTQCCV